MTTLAHAQTDYIASWRRDTHLADWSSVVNTATSVYVPALEAEVNRLRGLLGLDPMTDTL